jgi:uncharacterized protein (DUF488 family)
MSADRVIYTLGTSTREFAEFLALLEFYRIGRVIDVRHFPTSRLAHFKKRSLCNLLNREGIDYFFLGDKLGGYRAGGYENYMHTKNFGEGIEYLEGLAEEKLSAFICAEKLFWRCHRRYIADLLIDRGWDVYHIIALGSLIKGTGHVKPE